MEVCRGSTIQILNFTDAVAIESRSPERLFKVLDVFETMRDLMPEFDAVFSNQYCLFLRNEAVTIWKRLGEAIRGIFMELENLISRDPAKTPVPGGGLHPITRYVMNYLRAACRSRQTLEQVFEDNAGVPHQSKVDDRASSSSMSVQMAWIMELLESNLEAKSKIYRDSGLCYVFMMNNGRYIVQKVKDSELGSLLGDDWIRKHSAKVRQYHVNYQRSAWNKVVGVLKLESGSLAPNAAVKSMKEKLKLRVVVREATEIFGEFNFSDFNWIWKKFNLQGFQKRTEVTHKKFDVLVEKVISEREELRKMQRKGNITEEKDVKGFLYMVLDTGSDVVWLQCAPCKRCYSQTDPVFDPRKSSSFSSLPCSSPLCRHLDSPGCSSL
ncbi:hypothetical protein ACLB2K_008087 [Fragaria x ananassa]